jgi:hypothetical protein
MNTGDRTSWRSAHNESRAHATGVPILGRHPSPPNLRGRSVPGWKRAARAMRRHPSSAVRWARPSGHQAELESNLAGLPVPPSPHRTKQSRSVIVRPPVIVGACGAGRPGIRGCVAIGAATLALAGVEKPAICGEIKSQVVAGGFSAVPLT